MPLTVSNLALNCFYLRLFCLVFMSDDITMKINKTYYLCLSLNSTILERDSASVTESMEIK